MQNSAAGLALTKQHEGFRPHAYQDCSGTWTIGYGHTGPDVHPHLFIDEQQAEALLRADMQRAVDCVNKAVTAPLTQAQFDALCDFTFNVGSHAFVHSTLLLKLNAHDYAGDSRQFPLWVHAAGQVVPGLVARRAAEQEVFNRTDHAI